MEFNGKGLVMTAMYIIAKRRFKWTRKLLHSSIYDLVNICIKAKKKGIWSVWDYVFHKHVHIHGNQRWNPFLNKKFKDFQGRISHFSRTAFSAKKSLESMSLLVLPQHEQSHPKGLSVFAPFPSQFPLNYKVSIKI